MARRSPFDGWGLGADMLTCQLATLLPPRESARLAACGRGEHEVCVLQRQEGEGERLVVGELNVYAHNVHLLERVEPAKAPLPPSPLLPPSSSYAIPPTATVA